MIQFYSAHSFVGWKWYTMLEIYAKWRDRSRQLLVLATYLLNHFTNHLFEKHHVDVIPLMVRVQGNDLPGMVNSSIGISPWEIPWPNKSLAILSTANRVVPRTQIWLFMDGTATTCCCFSDLQSTPGGRINSVLTLWGHWSLKLRVPDHLTAQLACSWAYFTLVSGLRRPPRSFMCLHLLGFSVPTFLEELHHNGSWSIKGHKDSIIFQVWNPGSSSIRGPCQKCEFLCLKVRLWGWALRGHS